MRARDYRAQARAALKGKWLKTTICVLLALVLGAGSAGGGVSFGNFDFSTTFGEGEVPPELIFMMAAMALLASAISIAYSLFLGSYTRVGLVNLMDKIHDGEKPQADMIFPKNLYWRSVGMNFLRGLFTFLWSLLLIIPGIIAAYRYVYADYLLLHNPNMGAREALKVSSEHMKGRKWRLFCLEFSFIGWQLLALVPIWLVVIVGAIVVAAGQGSAGAGAVLMVALLVLIGILGLLVGSWFLQSYMNAAVVAFFRDIRRSTKWHEEAQEGEAYAEVAYGDGPYAASSFLGQTEPMEPALNADETVARDMFLDYGCSRRRMQEAGVLEDYDALNASPLSQERWKRDYGDDLMRRFDRDAAVLEDLLLLAGEYGLEDLLGRVLARIERHIRQETLPDAAILDMAGRTLMVLISEAFKKNPGFVRRKQDQIADMADRLEARLERGSGDGEWRATLECIRRMYE